MRWHWLIGWQVSSIHLYDIRAVYCTVCSPPSQTIFRHLVLGPLHAPHCPPPSLWQPPHWWQLYGPHLRKITWFLTFSDGLVSLSMIFRRSIVSSQMLVLNLFLCLNPVLLCTHTTPSLSSHLPKGTVHVSCLGHWMVLQWTQGCVCLCEYIFSFFFLTILLLLNYSCLYFLPTSLPHPSQTHLPPLLPPSALVFSMCPL